LQSFGNTGAPEDGVIPIWAGVLDTETRTFVNTTTDLSTVPDVPALNPTIWQTLEVGYKGLLLGSNLLLGVNAYYTDVDEFISSLTPFTPNLFLDGQTLAGYLVSQGVSLADAGLIAQNVGSAPAGENSLVGLPLGGMAPPTSGGETAAPILFTYQNLGDFNFFGADASLTYVLNQRWELGGSVSWVEKDLFPTGSDQGEPVPLNAPKWKGALTLGYRSPTSGLNGAVRGRYVDGFPIASGVYAGTVDSYAVFDLNVGYRFAGRSGLTLQLDMQNVFNDDFTSFVGTPNFGRYTVLRLLWHM
jgi:hypothetical protein